MIYRLANNFFDIRKGEYKISLFMFSYIFLIISVLLIIKPTINSLFLSELGAEQLSVAFILVALAAIVSSAFYTKILAKFELNRIIKATLYISIAVLLSLGILLKLQLMNTYLLFFFYTWVAIYAVLSASQFWVLANLVFNVRDAKRLFGFIGSGAILGGIFGGYLTSIFAPLLGNDAMIFIAALLLFGCFPLLRFIWKLRVNKLDEFKQKKRITTVDGHPFKLILKSRHLTYMALIVAVGVLVAKLVDYLFSDFAARSIEDPEELTAFFAFWFSSFNLLSLAVQLFLTHRIVGVWGVGFSLLLLPLGILFGSVFFLFLPELSAIVAIKAMDGVLKQSINKSASELLALPLPFDLKNKTKSFIDVVVDSVATGVAGILLIFFVKGLDVGTTSITVLIIFLVLVWIFFIGILRKEYYATFKKNLESATDKNKHVDIRTKPVSVLSGMRNVFAHGTEEQILFMLNKLMEINDRRFTDDVVELLEHPSLEVKAAAMRNLYYLNSSSMVANIPQLLKYGDEELTLATFEYLLLHADQNEEFVFDEFLDSDEELIRDTALFCLARESAGNHTLKLKYDLKGRLQSRLESSSGAIDPLVLKAIGASGYKQFYPIILDNLDAKNEALVRPAIVASGISMSPLFIDKLLHLLPNKLLRPLVVEALNSYGPRILPILVSLVKKRKIPLQVCRFVPLVIKSFKSKEAVHYLFQLFDDVDLSVRLEVVRALSDIRKERPTLHFNRFKVIAKIFEECKLYHQTLSAMHTQIIISYRNRKKSGAEIKMEERDARASLLELLERRLDAGLERIFKLLGLKYVQEDVQNAYLGLLSPKEEARNKAIEFLDNLLTGNLKQKLLPIIEEAVMDFSSEEAIQKIKHNIPSEMECFEQLLQVPDVKLKLAVLYLIGKQRDERYIPLLRRFGTDDDQKVRDFAEKALAEISGTTLS
ncbi:Npt1/Npt2 family nucleotide transporter [Flagellimonas crocea]|uniref:Npt1/Npt2 family nucleotide transporter n=1 Tax=Flagellimonas crocea TaxID=3067311 RepID=UPI00296F4647|nr:Npt1/Npt2 family nucleotide transporter [Muricauda sp. DH64]